MYAYRYSQKWLSAVCGITLLSSALAFAAGLTHWAVVEKARACLRGDEVVVIPAAVNLGACERGAALKPLLQIVNLISSPVTVTGISTPCSCVLAESLPVTIQPYATHTLGLTIHTPEQVGGFERTATIYTSSRVSPQFEIAISGTTRAAINSAVNTRDTSNTENHAEPFRGGNNCATEREPELAASPTAKSTE